MSNKWFRFAWIFNLLAALLNIAVWYVTSNAINMFMAGLSTGILLMVIALRRLT